MNVASEQQIEQAEQQKVSERKVRLKFLSATIEKPKEIDLKVNNWKEWGSKLWKATKEAVDRRYETPDSYIVVFLNGQLVFLTPPDAVQKDTYNPKWDVMMPNFMDYSIINKDELVILVKDKDSEAIKTTADLISGIQLIVKGKPYGLRVGVDENSFREDDALGRWSGKIPAEILQKGVDSIWKLSFGKINSLEIFVEFPSN